MTVGQFTATLSNSEKYDVADIYVVQGTHNAGSLLGSGSATALGILRIVNHVKLDCSQNGESDSATVKGTQLSCNLVMITISISITQIYMWIYNQMRYTSSIICLPNYILSLDYFIFTTIVMLLS